jgi:hypothetical protein
MNKRVSRSEYVINDGKRGSLALDQYDETIMSEGF